MGRCIPDLFEIIFEVLRRWQKRPEKINCRETRGRNAVIIWPDTKEEKRGYVQRVILDKIRWPHVSRWTDMSCKGPGAKLIRLCLMQCGIDVDGLVIKRSLMWISTTKSGTYQSILIAPEHVPSIS